MSDKKPEIVNRLRKMASEATTPQVAELFNLLAQKAEEGKMVIVTYEDNIPKPGSDDALTKAARDDLDTIFAMHEQSLRSLRRLFQKGAHNVGDIKDHRRNFRGICFEMKSVDPSVRIDVLADYSLDDAYKTRAQEVDSFWKQPLHKIEQLVRESAKVGKRGPTLYRDFNPDMN